MRGETYYAVNISTRVWVTVNVDVSDTCGGSVVGWFNALVVLHAYSFLSRVFVAASPVLGTDFILLFFLHSTTMHPLLVFLLPTPLPPVPVV